MRYGAPVRALSLVLIGLQVMACSRSVHVPPSAYDDVEPSQARYWRVTTTDGRIYWMERFTVTDSTFVVERASRVYASSRAEPDAIAPSDLPIVIARDTVAALERREIDKVRTAIVATAVLGVLALVVIAALQFEVPAPGY